MNISAPFIRRPVATSLLTRRLLLRERWRFICCRSRRCRRWNSDDLRSAPACRARVRKHGLGRSDSAGAPVRTHRRRNRDDLVQPTGITGITLQFDLNRNIDAAARDVQAAINAARGQLPANLPSNPSYRKVNPADAPILILALTSDTDTVPQMYDAADSILAQKLSQIEGVGQVFVGGGARPAVRVEDQSHLLNKLRRRPGHGATALGSANANQPKGAASTMPVNAWTTGRQRSDHSSADEYHRLIVAYRNGAPVRLGDVAKSTIRSKTSATRAVRTASPRC